MKHDDELGVFISLAIVLGIVIGAVTVMWMWNALVGGGEVVSPRIVENP